MKVNNTSWSRKDAVLKLVKVEVETAHFEILGGWKRERKVN